MFAVTRYSCVTGSYLGRRYLKDRYQRFPGKVSPLHPTSYEPFNIWSLDIHGIVQSSVITEAELLYYNTRNIVLLLKYFYNKESGAFKEENIAINDIGTFISTYSPRNIYTLIACKSNTHTAFLISNTVCKRMSLSLLDCKVPLAYRIIIKPSDTHIGHVWTQTSQGLPFVSIVEKLRVVFPDAVIHSKSQVVVIFTADTWSDRFILASRGQVEYLR